MPSESSSDHDKKVILPQARAVQLTGREDCPNVPLPKFKTNYRRPLTKISKDNIAIAKNNVTNLLPVRLEYEITKSIGHLRRFNPEDIDQRLVALKRKLENFKSLHGIYSQVDRMHGELPGTTSRILAREGFRVIDYWYPVVQEKFYEIANRVREECENKAKELAPKKKTGKHFHHIRVPVTDLLRDDLTQWHQRSFIVKCISTAIYLTDHATWLVRAMTSILEHSAKHGFELKEDGAILLNPEPSPGIFLRDLVPKHAIREPKISFEDYRIPVAPLPEGLDKLNDFEQFERIYSRSHLEYINTHFMNKWNLPQEKDDPLFNQLGYGDIEELWTPRKHMWRTVTSSICTIHNDMHEIWMQRKLFQRALDQLVRLLLEFWLAPDREHDNRVVRIVEHNERAKKEKNTMRHIEMSAARKRYLVQKELNAYTAVYDKYRQLIKEKDELTENRKSKAKQSKVLSDKDRQQRLDDIHKEIARSESDLPSLYNRLFDASASETIKSELSESDSRLPSKDESVEDDAEVTQPSATTKEKPDKQESSYRVITFLKNSAVKMLLEGDCTDQYWESQFQGYQPKPHEKEVVLRICRILKPYVPPKRGIHIPVLALPLVTIANEVFYATGYRDFVYDYTYVPTETVQTIHMHPQILFELFGSKGGEFQLNSAPGCIINSPRVAKCNKLVTYQNFFSIRKIDQLCEASGMHFDDFINIYPDRTAGIRGVYYDDPDAVPAPSSSQLESKQHTETSKATGSSNDAESLTAKKAMKKKTTTRKPKAEKQEQS